MPRRRSPIGTQVASPLQRTCTSLLRNGSIARIAAHVFGAFSSSSRALNVYLPAVMRSMRIAGVRYAADGEGITLDARARYDDRQARSGSSRASRDAARRESDCDGQGRWAWAPPTAWPPTPA